MKSFVIFTSLILTVVIVCSEINEEESKKKYCEPSLSEAKIVELEKCDQYFLGEVLDVGYLCMKEINNGTTYEELRNILCDQSKNEKYDECMMENIDETTLLIINWAYILQKLDECYKQVFDSKNLKFS